MYCRANFAMVCLVLLASHGWGQKEARRDESADKKSAAIKEKLIGKWDGRPLGKGSGTVLIFEANRDSDEKVNLRIVHYERDTDNEGIKQLFLSIRINEQEAKIVGEGTKLKLEKKYEFKLPTFKDGVVGEKSVRFSLDGDKLVLDGDKVLLRDDLDPLKLKKEVSLKGTWYRMK